jgi:hypothetical protein
MRVRGGEIYREQGDLISQLIIKARDTNRRETHKETERETARFSHGLLLF